MGGQLRNVGLARALSKLGYCSRSQADDLIRSGRVRLNGSVKRDPQTPVLLERDRITVHGTLIRPAEKVYLMLNKPRGVVTTASDEKGRPTIYSALRNSALNNSALNNSALNNDLPWLAPVGRLDKASEGVLLLTNDSEWAAAVLSPATHLQKTYHVQVSGTRNAELTGALMRGLSISDGEFLRVTDARVLRQGNRNTWLTIVLEEGRNRHIRRMLEQLGIEVLRLVRVAIGPLTLGNLAKGAYRPLTIEEKSGIDSAMKQLPDGPESSRRRSV
jgi:23S rRNA pseudouridine2605 synthase